MIHFGSHWSESWKCVEVRARWRVHVSVCVCVQMWTHVLLVLWADVSLLKIDVQEENKKACYFSTHLWACEKCEAHLILLVKVFLIRARFFPFCSCWGEASIFGIETSTSLTRTCNQSTFNQTPIHISVVLLISLSTCSSVNSADSELPTWHRP